jgi:hypothetical protein
MTGFSNPIQAAQVLPASSPATAVGIGIGVLGRVGGEAGAFFTGGGGKEVFNLVGVGGKELVERNGFKFTAEYYEELWNSGRNAPGLRAQLIKEGAGESVPDRLSPNSSFVEYSYDGWRLVVDPITNYVQHLGR